jgi:hypothetical protein
LTLGRRDRLRFRVTELARLADDDPPGADDEDGGDVGAFGHYFFLGSGRSVGKAVSGLSSAMRT